MGKVFYVDSKSRLQYNVPLLRSLGTQAGVCPKTAISEMTIEEIPTESFTSVTEFIGFDSAESVQSEANQEPRRLPRRGRFTPATADRRPHQHCALDTMRELEVAVAAIHHYPIHRLQQPGRSALATAYQRNRQHTKHQHNSHHEDGQHMPQHHRLPHLSAMTAGLQLSIAKTKSWL